MFGIFSLLTIELGAMGLVPIIAKTFGVSAADQSIKATSKIFMAISAGMTLGIPLATYIASFSSLEFTFMFFCTFKCTCFYYYNLFCKDS